MSSVWESKRKHIRLHHAAGALATLTAIIAIIATALPDYLYAYGRVDGTLTAIDIGIWQNKYNIGPDSLGFYLKDRRQNDCDLGEFQLTDAGTISNEPDNCHVALNHKCRTLKACSCLGNIINAFAAVLCFINYRRWGALTSAFAGLMYLIVFAVFASIKEGDATPIYDSGCGYRGDPDLPGIKYSASFYMMVVVCCLCFIVATMMVSLEWCWVTPSPKKNSVAPLQHRSTKAMGNQASKTSMFGKSMGSSGGVSESTSPIYRKTDTITETDAEA